MPQRARRGYAVAVLIGFSQSQTTIWRIFSESARLEVALDAPEEDARSVYAHYEKLVDLLRPVMKSGVRSLLVAHPPRLNLHEGFLEHIKKRHRWITEGGTAIGEIQGTAESPAHVQALARDTVFKNVLGETTAQESEKALRDIERGLEKNEVLFTLEEIQRSIRSPDKPEIILLTDSYYEEHRRSRRLQSALQLAQNSLIQTKIIKRDTPAGQRLDQFGGLVAVR